jgi:hypothetical protein
MIITSPTGTKRTFAIGADPEFFVKMGGKAVSAYNLVPGTKDAPYKVPRGAVQVDGMALEFNIDPADTYTQFERSMSSVLDTIIRMVPGYEILAESVTLGGVPTLLPMCVADFGEDYINSQPDVAKELGCSPDFNAYTKKANPRPDANTPFRTASGHVHIGWTSDVDVNDEGHLEACRALTKSLDIWLGIPSLTWDRDDRRRALYGKAGAFRPKPYGMEYRVLSNSWITEPLLRKTVYYNTVEAIKATFENPEYGDTKFHGLSAQEVINKDSPNWKEAFAYALGYGSVRSPKWYRENKA